MMDWHKQFDGVLLIDKPSGMTSHDVVQKVRHLLRQREVGHSGTLDPLSTGLLVLCIGKGTKISQFLTAEFKSYIADVQLGMRSPTYDAEGITTETEHCHVPPCTADELQAILNDYLGLSIQQVPPYSAVRVDGKHLYEMTRKGEAVKLPEREIEIAEIQLTEFNSPNLRFKLTCSSGTYVRSIANDIGERLGCGAYLSGLRRTAVGELAVEQAWTLEKLEQAVGNDATETVLLPISQALRFAQITLTAEASRLVSFGRPPEWNDISAINGTFSRGEKLLAKNETGQPIAVLVAGAPSADYQAGNGHPVQSFVRVFV
jgi:tRNA pseudouridine55 synthase